MTVPNTPAVSRRRVMQMLAAAVAALAAGPEVAGLARRVTPPRSTWNGKTRWIGHC